MTLYFVGSSVSPHVRWWVRTLSKTYKIKLYDINHSGNPLIFGKNVTVETPLSAVRTSRLKLVQYVLLGAWLRTMGPSEVLHAHNTSGFGLSALLSGKKYIVTTYGSEIYQAHARGALFNGIIKTVLRKASLVTASTPDMADTLISKFGVEPGKIFCGNAVDDIFLQTSRMCDTPDQYTWFVNRRVTSLYRTLEVVEAFKLFIDGGGKGYLLLLEGDSDENYLEKVRVSAALCTRIRIVSGFVSQEEIVSLMSSVQFAISVPKSDQLSNSILEAAACCVVPVLIDLPCYNPVRGISIMVRESGEIGGELLAMFSVTSCLPPEKVREMGLSARLTVRQKFSSQQFLEDFANKVKELC